MGRKALLIIDMLNDFVAEGAPLRVPGIEKIIGPIKREMENARMNQCPVIYICDSHDPDDHEFDMFAPHAVKNTPGAKIIDELRPQGSDIIIKKPTLSSFHKTNLKNVLDKMGINHLVIVGCVTNICIFITAIEGKIRGYQVDVVKDAVAGLNDQDHHFALRQMKTVFNTNIVEKG